MNFGFSYAPAVSATLYTAEQMAAFNAALDAAVTAEQMDDVLFEATAATRSIRYSTEAQSIDDEYNDIFHDTIFTKEVSVADAKPRAKELLKRIARFRR